MESYAFCGQVFNIQKPDYVELMINPAGIVKTSVEPSTEIDQVLNLMKDNHLEKLPVIDIDSF